MRQSRQRGPEPRGRDFEHGKAAIHLHDKGREGVSGLRELTTMRGQTVDCVLGGAGLSSSECASDPLDASGEVRGERERIEASGISRRSG
jgi:hypothetical protein